MAVFETADLTAASYSTALLGLAATSVFLLLGTGWVKRGWKLPVALCALAALVGVGAVYEAREAWAANPWLSLSGVRSAIQDEAARAAATKCIGDGGDG